MISEKELQKVATNCPSKQVCVILIEYRDLSARYITLRKIKANLIKAFEAEVERLKVAMEKAGISMDGLPPTKWNPDKYK